VGGLSIGHGWTRTHKTKSKSREDQADGGKGGEEDCSYDGFAPGGAEPGSSAGVFAGEDGLHQAALGVGGEVAHGLGDFLAAAAVGDQDSGGVGAVGGFQEARAQGAGDVIDLPKDLVGADGGDHHRGGLEHGAGFAVDFAATRATRRRAGDLTSASIATHRATTLGTLAFSFSTWVSSPR